MNNHKNQYEFITHQYTDIYGRIVGISNFGNMYYYTFSTNLWFNEEGYNFNLLPNGSPNLKWIEYNNNKVIK